MFNEPRNWKWMVPGFMVSVMVVAAYFLFTSAEQWVNICGIIPAGMFWVFLVAAWKNYRMYFEDNEVSNLVARQKALAITPVTELANAFKSLHPAYAKTLSMYLQTVWLIKEGKAPGDLVDYVLYGPTIPVHVDFVIHVLKQSSSTSVMPKRLLTEGAKHWDPEERVTDYEQYDALMAYWRSQGRITAANGNLAAQWIYPWDKKAVALAMDIDLGDIGMEGEKDDQVE